MRLTSAVSIFFAHLKESDKIPSGDECTKFGLRNALKPCKNGTKTSVETVY